MSDFYIPDPTNEFEAFLSINEKRFFNRRNYAHPAKLFWFAEQVKTGSRVDLKNDDRFKREKHSYHVILHGEVVRGDTPGNLTYGYLGTAAGISEYMLLLGAGINQIILDKRPIWDVFVDFGDNPGDGNQIKLGVMLYWMRQGFTYSEPFIPDPAPGPAPRG